jgi:YD repeat-containing protein
MIEGQDQPAGTYVSSSWDPPSTRPPPPHRRPPSTHTWIRLAFRFVLIVLLTWGTLYRAAYNRSHSRAPVLHHGGVARSDQFHGSGRIYLLQLGPHAEPCTVQDLAEWLRDKYTLDTQILQATALDPAAWDSSRHLYIAELLYAQIKREHPTLAVDQNSWLIGFTDAGMYSATQKWDSTFSQRDHHRAAIISSSGMADSAISIAWLLLTTLNYTPKSTIPDRLRRILLRDVAILYWHLSLNNDPGSLLQPVFNPDLPINDIYQSDLDPARSPWGEIVGDPCILFTESAETGLKVSTGALIRECEHPESADEEQSSLDTPDSPPDTSQERIEIRLRYGLLTEKHTDFYLPGPVPIRFERATSNRWLMPVAFGVSGSHNYDRYLASHDGMRHISVSNAGSGDTSLVRVPAWLSFLAFNKWTDINASESNLTLRWRAAPVEHFDLSRYNGEVENYMPCADSEICYMNGYRSSNGSVLAMQRDSRRRLTSISAPQENWLRLNYDLQHVTQNRITDILDSRGRRIFYRYDTQGQLASVSYPSGEVISYRYDSLQNLISVSAAPNATASTTTLITNHFLNGRLVSQIFDDGSVYSYRYLPAGGGEASMAAVQAPDGTTYTLTFGSEGAAVRQRPSAPLHHASGRAPASPAAARGIPDCLTQPSTHDPWPRSSSWATDRRPTGTRLGVNQPPSANTKVSSMRLKVGRCEYRRTP